MENTIIINQQLTFKEFVSSTLYFYLTGSLLKRFFAILFAILLVSLLLGLGTTDKGLDTTMIIGTVAPVIFLLAAATAFVFLSCLYIFKSKPSIFKNVSYEFTHWGIIRHADKLEFSRPWRDITDMKETKAFFLLYVGKTDFHIIQKRLIGDSIKFRLLLKSNLSH